MCLAIMINCFLIFKLKWCTNEEKIPGDTPDTDSQERDDMKVISCYVMEMTCRLV